MQLDGMYSHARRRSAIVELRLVSERSAVRIRSPAPDQRPYPCGSAIEYVTVRRVAIWLLPRSQEEPDFMRGLIRFARRGQSSAVAKGSRFGLWHSFRDMVRRVADGADAASVIMCAVRS
jgi:hypothetical protein